MPYRRETGSSPHQAPKVPVSQWSGGLSDAACKLQLRRRSAILLRMTGTGTTGSTSRHCTRRAPDNIAQTRPHATSSSHAARSGPLPAGRHLRTRGRSHTARTAFGASLLLLPPMPAEQRASLTALLHPGSSNTPFSSSPPFAAPPAGRIDFKYRLLDVLPRKFWRGNGPGGGKSNGAGK